MMQKKNFFLGSVALTCVTLLLFLAACSDNPVMHEDSTRALTAQVGDQAGVLTGLESSKTTEIANLTPELGEGNFVAEDDYQLCYAIFEDAEESGLDFHGFKVDSNDPFENAFIETIISSDKKELKWIATNATVKAVIMKGGPNYNLYDYATPRHSQGTPDPAWNGSTDSWLTSPSHQSDRFGNLRYPEISHYNFCYVPDVPEGDQGCTPGYWRNHADRWLIEHDGTIYLGFDAVALLFDDVFSVAYLPGITLGTAIDNPQTYGTFVFHAVAGLLNAFGGIANDPGGETVDYPYTPAQVIAMVQGAINGDLDMEGVKDALASANELGCPLSGTRAVPVE